jgi:fibronectin-binding autotransporter adhesin
MKIYTPLLRSLRASHCLLTSAAFALMLGVNAAEAQFTFATDQGSNYGGGGEPTFGTGGNGGSGFNAWSFDIGGSAGGFIGNPSSANILSMDAESFGLFANPTNSGNFINANRSLSTAMGVGDVFSFQWGVNFDAAGPGSKGFNLYIGTDQIINVNMGGSSSIFVNGTNTGFGYGRNPMTWSFYYTNATTLVVTANDRDGSGSYSNNFTVTGGIDNFRWYAAQLSSASFTTERQPYYNNLISTNSGVFSSGSTVTNGNTFSGSGSLSVGNNTLLVLNGGGNNNYTGTTTISSGSTLNLAGGGNSSFGSAISGGGALTKSGGGTATLTGGNSSFTGKTTISGGALSIDSEVRLGTAPGSFVADQLTLGNGVLETTATFGLAANRGITLNSGTVGVMRVASGTALTNNAVITGSGNLAKEGMGTLTLMAANTHSGETRLREGVLLVGNDAAFGTGAIQISFLAGFGSKTLAAEGSSARTITNTLLIYNDLMLGQAAANAGSLTFSGTTELGNEAGLRTIVTAAGTSHTFSGAINGLRGMVKQGSGTLVLSGANTFTGTLFADEGVTELAGGSLAGGFIDVGGGVNGNAVNASDTTLRVSTNGTFGRTIFINSETNSSGVSGARTVEFANSGGTATLSGDVTLEKALGVNVTNSSAVGQLSGVISGSGAFGKTGAGTLVLAGSSANTLTGATTVSDGTLELANSSGEAVVGNLTVASGAKLLIAASNQVGSTGGQTVTLSGGTIERASGVSEVMGNLSLSATSTLDYGTGTAGNLQFGTYSPTSGVLLTLNNFGIGNTLRFSSELSSFISSATGTSFANDYFSISGMSSGGFTASFSAGTFTITSVPEPSTVLAALGLGALLLWPVRRRLTVRDR